MTLDDWMAALETQGVEVLGPLADWAEESGREDWPFWRECWRQGWLPTRGTSSWPMSKEGGNRCWEWRPHRRDGCLPEGLFHITHELHPYCDPEFGREPYLGFLEFDTMADAYLLLHQAWLSLTSSSQEGPAEATS